jgi:hypothetical protein
MPPKQAFIPTFLLGGRRKTFLSLPAAFSLRKAADSEKKYELK